jgi:hypothetical protein
MDLVGISEDGQTHFNLSNGTFKCYYTVINGFVNDGLRFLNSSISDNAMDISDLTFANNKININGYHFNIRGDSNVSDSVCFYSIEFKSIILDF